MAIPWLINGSYELKPVWPGLKLMEVWGLGPNKYMENLELEFSSISRFPCFFLLIDYDFETQVLP